MISYIVHAEIVEIPKFLSIQEASILTIHGLLWLVYFLKSVWKPIPPNNFVNCTTIATAAWKLSIQCTSVSVCYGLLNCNKL